MSPSLIVDAASFAPSTDHIHQEARRNPDVIGLRLYVEDSNQPAQRTYQAWG